jgi:hypothetical protein
MVVFNFPQGFLLWLWKYDFFVVQMCSLYSQLWIKIIFNFVFENNIKMYYIESSHWFLLWCMSTFCFLGTKNFLSRCIGLNSVLHRLSWEMVNEFCFNYIFSAVWMYEVKFKPLLFCRRWSVVANFSSASAVSTVTEFITDVLRMLISCSGFRQPELSPNPSSEEC